MPSKTCRRGFIMRKGYTRKSFVRKSGTRASGTHITRKQIAPNCIKATGLSIKRGYKGKQLFVLKKGELTKYGYHANLSENKRHRVLRIAIKDIKPLSLYRKLNALYVLNKNKDKTRALLYRKDANFVKSTTEYIHRAE